MGITPANSQILMRVAQWIVNSNHRTVSTIRELAETEENYRIIIREHDRVEGQLSQAQKFHVEATLTLVDWLHTLNHFRWQCAYCQSQPFQIMIHFVPLPDGGGTTSDNCVPCCYRCRRYRDKENERVHAYLAHIRQKKDEGPQSDHKGEPLH